jgi:hypothetical protein
MIYQSHEKKLDSMNYSFGKPSTTQPNGLPYALQIKNLKI